MESVVNVHSHELRSFNPFGSHLSIAHEFFKQAREEQPVFFSEALNAWCVTTYDDIKYVVGSPSTFSSHDAFPKPTGLPDAAQRAMDFFYDNSPLTMLDPPEHATVRRIVHKGFNLKTISAAEVQIREIVDRFTNRLPKNGRFDLVADFAAKVPLAATMNVIGLPEDAYDLMTQMTDDLVTLILGHHALGLEESNKRGQALNAGFTYLRGLVEDRLATPRDDLISMMAHSEADGTHLSVSEVAVNALNLLAAGWETTSDALASIVATLLEHPQHWTAVARGEADVQAKASEALRYDGTSIGVMRTASADATIRGVRIKKGERLMLCFASGNQDSAKFEDPEQFMIERKHASPHLTFGHGIHDCVGAALAKLELVLMLELLAQRFPHLTRADDKPLAHKQMSQLKGLKELWLTPS